MRKSQLEIGEVYLTESGQAACLLELDGWEVQTDGECAAPYRLGGKCHLVGLERDDGTWRPWAIPTRNFRAKMADYAAERARLDAARDEYGAAVEAAYNRGNARAKVLQSMGLQTSLHGTRTALRRVIPRLEIQTGRGRIDAVGLWLVELHQLLVSDLGRSCTEKLYGEAVRKVEEIVAEESVKTECDYLG